MKNTAVIFGAGKTGRGFAAHLAYLSKYQITLIDNDKDLITSLQNEKQYKIEVLGNNEKDCIVDSYKAFHSSKKAWIENFINAKVVFTAVFGNNLKELSQDLTKGIKARFLANPSEKFTIITCENYTHAAAFIKNEVIANLGDNKEIVSWLNENIGFSESMILRTCLNKENSLTVLAQDFFELPCDGENFKNDLSDIKGLKPLQGFENQLVRKIYTYNCINAVITYMGAQKGYTQLYEGGNDEEIVKVARMAAQETSTALIAEYNFDKDEQAIWVESAFNKFANRNIPDPIDRNGADPMRKLSKNDRLIGPANFALKHGIQPNGIIKGLIAGFSFLDTNKNIKIMDMIEKNGIDFVLTSICGLQTEDELFNLIKTALINKNPEGV